MGRPGIPLRPRSRCVDCARADAAERGKPSDASVVPWGRSRHAAIVSVRGSAGGVVDTAAAGPGVARQMGRGWISRRHACPHRARRAHCREAATRGGAGSEGAASREPERRPSSVRQRHAMARRFRRSGTTRNGAADSIGLGCGGNGRVRPIGRLRRRLYARSSGKRRRRRSIADVAELHGRTRLRTPGHSIEQHGRSCVGLFRGGSGAVDAAGVRWRPTGAWSAKQWRDDRAGARRRHGDVRKNPAHE